MSDQVYGNGVSFSNAHNSIVRYIRFRMGKGGDSGKDGISLADGDNLIFDHISASWGRDETFSISGQCRLTCMVSQVLTGIDWIKVLSTTSRYPTRLSRRDLRLTLAVA